MLSLSSIVDDFVIFHPKAASCAVAPYQQEPTLPLLLSRCLVKIVWFTRGGWEEGAVEQAITALSLIYALYSLPLYTH
jgi:hypothetical protein